MGRLSRFLALTVGLVIALLVLPHPLGAQRGVVRRRPPQPPPARIVQGQVFIGGYFYDPFFGPYPWWPRTAYPHWYMPVYDDRAFLRIKISPDDADDASVYVDGFYAGVVDDFDGVFQGLPVTPGGHTVVLYLDGYRTVRRNIYLSPASTFNLRETLQRLPPGAKSELPEVAAPVPPPPSGSYKTPVTPPKLPTPATPAAPYAVGFGTIDLLVQPTNAEVLIDGEHWESAEAGHLIVQVPAGRHRVEVRRRGYRTFATEIEVTPGDSTPLNVSLILTTS